MAEQAVISCRNGKATSEVKSDEDEWFDPCNSVLQAVENDANNGQEWHSDEETGVDDVEGISVFHGTPIYLDSFILSVVC